MFAPRKSPWKLAGIVAILATMLGGAFFGFQSGGGFRDGIESALESILARHDANPSNTAISVKKKMESGKLTSTRGTSTLSTDKDSQSLADIIRSGDEARLARLMPEGITEIEGSGGRGLGRQVKSHGMWFPVFDLSKAKHTANASTADDSDPADNTDPETVKVTKVPLSIISPPPSPALVSTVFTHTFAAVGGTPPYQWAIQFGNSEANARFTLDPTTGVLSGFSNDPISTSLTISATDTVGEMVSALGYLSITPVKSLAITTATLPAATRGQAYQAALEADGGMAPYTWTLTTESPDWTCDPATGTLSGTGSDTGEVSLAITVTDAQLSTAQTTLQLRITEGLEIKTETPLPPAAPTESYKLAFEAQGGAPPYVWSVAAGQLPQGWQLDGEGILRGIAANAEQRHHFIVQVRDSAGLKYRKPVELAIRRGLIVVPSRECAGLAWQPAEISRALGTALAGITVERDGREIYRGTGNNFVDHGLATAGTYKYTLTAYTTDGHALPYASSIAIVLPQSLQRGIAGVRGDPFADRVTSFQPLTPFGYGAAALPTNVTGPPDGRGTFSPAYRPQEVVSLHASTKGGGSIVLEFTDNIIENGSGPDFTVFENVLFENNDPNNRFMEPAFVEVALFEGQWFRFPARTNPPPASAPNLRQPGYYAQGFAGVNGTTGDDPTNPNRSGGDSFDLTNLGIPDLRWIRFIRIRSTGDQVSPDANGVLVRHRGDDTDKALSGTGSSGFDLDAVSAAHY